jgi:DNA-binding beta-propeller fold protein YncE
VRPRAIAIDSSDRLYLVDYTARIQVYTLEGKYLGPTWTPPDFRNGRPSGLGIARDGNLIVCDSHYHCLRIYSPEGVELRRIGGEGTGLNLGYVSDAVQDADGFFYLSEFGEHDRITKLTSEGSLVMSWGTQGEQPGQLNRARALALGPDGLLYVADACNHRIQVFTREGAFVRMWGGPGEEPRKLSYPYDLAFHPKGTLFVVEYGNHRVQEFTTEGDSLCTWGNGGRQPGQFANPWALAIDSKGGIHVADTENHRVQKFTR